MEAFLIKVALDIPALDTPVLDIPVRDIRALAIRGWGLPVLDTPVLDIPVSAPPVWDGVDTPTAAGEMVLAALCLGPRFGNRDTG